VSGWCDVRFTPLSLTGAFLVEIEALSDERGFFARTWCRTEFSRHGLNPNLEQCNLSHNTKRGTLRGMHWQAAPHGEAKLVCCLRGTIHDVIVDVREGSPTRGRWLAIELDAERHNALYIPDGFAHGFQTLTPDSDVFYQMSTSYHPASARGIAWNDPDLGIAWPIADPCMSDRDRAFPSYRSLVGIS